MSLLRQKKKREPNIKRLSENFAALVHELSANEKRTSSEMSEAYRQYQAGYQVSENVPRLEAGVRCPLPG
jgi:hypothetical protein